MLRGAAEYFCPGSCLDVDHHPAKGTRFRCEMQLGGFHFRMVMERDGHGSLLFGVPVGCCREAEGEGSEDAEEGTEPTTDKPNQDSEID